MQDRAIYYIFTDWKGMDKEEMLKIQLSRDQQLAAQWQSKKKSFHPLSSHTCVAEYGIKKAEMTTFGSQND